MFTRLLATAVAAMAAGTALAGTLVQVEITGQVVFNGIDDPPLGEVNGGDSAVITFIVDSDTFVDGVPGDVRAYEIDQASFSMVFGGDITQELLDPYPTTPYFGVIDGFPVSDGFFVSSSTNSPGGVALEQEPFNANFSVGYVGTTLDSLDILDAVGTYDFTGLTNFGYNLWAIFPDNVALEIDFAQMTISVVDDCTAQCLGDLNGDGFVAGDDLGLLLGAWNTGDPCANISGDGTVDGNDLGILLAEWGPCS